jgi:hypothetical protein
MDFEVYCDESGLEALTHKESHKFTLIGGIWMPSDFRNSFKASMDGIKSKFNVYGELKWNKVSPAYKELYKEVLIYFFDTPELRFRTIIIESKTVDNIRFNNSDAELGFYKFYYQLLQHWISDFNNYTVFIDFKVNRDKGRVKILKKVMDASNITSVIKQIQALPSHESLGIQLADILTGLVAAKFNTEISSETKIALIELAEEKLGKTIAPTPKWEEKFNLFKINLQGGW